MSATVKGERRRFGYLRRSISKAGHEEKKEKGEGQQPCKGDYSTNNREEPRRKERNYSKGPCSRAPGGVPAGAWFYKGGNSNLSGGDEGVKRRAAKKVRQFCSKKATEKTCLVKIPSGT